jgi:hypothetical protein
MEAFSGILQTGASPPPVRVGLTPAIVGEKARTLASRLQVCLLRRA